MKFKNGNNVKTIGKKKINFNLDKDFSHGGGLWPSYYYYQASVHIDPGGPFIHYTKRSYYPNPDSFVMKEYIKKGKGYKTGKEARAHAHKDLNEIYQMVRTWHIMNLKKK